MVQLWLILILGFLRASSLLTDNEDLLVVNSNVIGDDEMAELLGASNGSYIEQYSPKIERLFCLFDVTILVSTIVLSILPLYDNVINPQLFLEVFLGLNVAGIFSDAAQLVVLKNYAPLRFLFCSGLVVLAEGVGLVASVLFLSMCILKERCTSLESSQLELKLVLALCALLLTIGKFAMTFGEHQDPIQPAGYLTVN